MEWGFVVYLSFSVLVSNETIYLVCLSFVRSVLCPRKSFPRLSRGSSPRPTVLHVQTGHVLLSRWRRLREGSLCALGPRRRQREIETRGPPSLKKKTFSFFLTPHYGVSRSITNTQTTGIPFRSFFSRVDGLFPVPTVSTHLRCIVGRLVLLPDSPVFDRLDYW